MLTVWRDDVIGVGLVVEVIDVEAMICQTNIYDKLIITRKKKH
jgi:hypothetical protein